jgi:hypothetical protein
MMRTLIGTIGVLLAALAVAGPAEAKTTWLCKPGFTLAQDPCVGDLTTTTIAADGTATVRPARSDPDAPVDCFYVYPTVTRAAGTNAPLAVEPSVTGVARFQAKPFSEACRIYAPLYRQITNAGFSAALTDRSVFRTAYRDVRAAWREYLRRHNRGRGVVLIGHSQGSAMLRALIRREIDPQRSVRRRLVSALLIGGNVLVRQGRDAGGDFRRVPACRRASQFGCVVAYSTYDTTPPADAGFPRADGRLSEIIGAPGPEGLEVLCTNPAALRTGGPAPLRTVSVGASTPLAAYPGLYTGRCRSQGELRWFQVSSSAADPRAGVRFPVGSGESGLHLFDINIALGDLVDLVRRQARAYARDRDD